MISFRRYFFFLSALVYLFCCGCGKPKMEVYILRSQTALDSLSEAQSIASKRIFSACDDPLSYAPDTSLFYLNPIRRIRVIFHVMNSQSGDQNYSKDQARKFFKYLLDGAQDHIDHLLPMNLPENNTTLVLPARYRYVLADVAADTDHDGVLHHYDDELYYFINKGKNRNNYDKEVIRKYAVGNDSILNIFAMPHHLDSVASPSYKVTNAGIALGNNLKIAGMFETNGEPWQFQSLLNHEIGHVLGLGHSWEKYDRCDDTPIHANCFGRSDIPPCDGVVSNNMMDYNNSQRALTPCQLGTIHRNLSRLYSSQRQLLERDWCQTDTTANILIQSDQLWNRSVDLVHNVIVQKDKSLTISCRVSFAPGTSLTLHPGAELILDGARLHNDCGKKWLGIILQYDKNNKSRVIQHRISQLEDVEDPLHN